MIIPLAIDRFFDFRVGLKCKDNNVVLYPLTKFCCHLTTYMCSNFYFKVGYPSLLGLTMPWLGLWLTTSLMSCLTSKFATGWVSSNVTRCCKHSCETTTTHIYRKYCWPCRTSTQIGHNRPPNIHQTLRSRSVGKNANTSNASMIRVTWLHWRLSNFFPTTSVAPIDPEGNARRGENSP